jgi:hypothetical protein
MKPSRLQITLLKLKDGTRLLRLSESETGVALERVMDPSLPLWRQKQELTTLFASTLNLASRLLTQP